MELFDIPKHGESRIDSAVLVQMKLHSLGEQRNEQEFKELVRSAGAREVAFIQGSRSRPDSRFFVGKGKAEELHLIVENTNPDVVIFDHDLSPAQERNLEKELQCRVMDRTGLILDIFAQRARSHEGKLQVELAQLRHMSTRLIRGWTHLERQKGGIGMRGPGETQLETDRRLISIRIKQIDKRLNKVNKQREQGRQSRKKAEIPTVSLVGYTNAGKSTLFNQMTQSEVYAADLLFATLDPTLRRIDLENQQTIILADTVGFIRDLPHELVAAFRATLQETTEADLILHVMDSHDEDRDEYKVQVNEVIHSLGAEATPQIEVMNKIDLLNQEPRIEYGHDGVPTRVWLSAMTNSGIEKLLEVLSQTFADRVFIGDLILPPALGRLRALLYEEDAVTEESISEKGEYLLNVSIKKRRLNSILSKESLDLKQLTKQ
ncbi:ribosome rescue GTPase HflX [Leucothrix arctica]|uniref:GTPase HflX n=1 Tax=Leucothrix arctica TaxID=1481894 RepID=A0A317CG03_9GAMM|nr:ribosome rescue GTPase HflX [Leucothrix arctica]PWQ96343.1 GTPase HflX [Leucothrix arctica]